MADEHDESHAHPPTTLSDDQIVSRRGPNRRTLLLGAFGGVAVAAAAGSEANAATDRDSGRNADPAGRGRSGLTDNDNGSYADLAGHGRGSGGRRSGVTDRDNGSVFDQPGFGRGGT
jgi:hypothetical protein